MCTANDSPRFIGTQVEYVVVSVGPLRLHTVLTSVVAKMRSTNARFNGSPARFITRTVLGTPPTSRSAFIAEGTVLMRVTSACLRARSSAFGTIQTLAPTVIGTKHS